MHIVLMSECCSRHGMDVVAQRTQCRDANRESLDSFLQQIAETNSARLVKANTLATVPAWHHMIDSARTTNACSPCHQTRTFQAF